MHVIDIGLHGSGDSGNPVDSAGSPRKWDMSYRNWKLLESRGDGML